jgi:hypothetical protein
VFALWKDMRRITLRFNRPTGYGLCGLTGEWKYPAEYAFGYPALCGPVPRVIPGRETTPATAFSRHRDAKGEDTATLHRKELLSSQPLLAFSGVAA